MQNMGKINIKMHVSDRACAADKQHREFFYKTYHILFGPGKIVDQLRSMLKNIEQKNAQLYRPFFYHIQVFSKLHVAVGFVDRSVGIAFYIVINADFFFTYYLFEIIPVPFFPGSPVSGKIFNDNRSIGPVKTFFKIFWADAVNNSYWF